MSLYTQRPDQHPTGGCHASTSPPLPAGATINGLWEPAGNMHLRAARSSLEADHLKESLEHVRLAFDAFQKAGRPERVTQALPRVLAALERHGHEAEAAQLREEFGPLPAGPGPGVPRGRRRPGRGTLPAEYPSCGATMNPTDVEWADPFTAICAYCGSMVKTEQPGS
jgi:hypothetical protein